MLQSMFQSARCFGLSDAAAWAAVDEAFAALGADATVADCLDEVAGALARQILVSEASRNGDRARARRRD
jgi:hypothetical protein